MKKIILIFAIFVLFLLTQPPSFSEKISPPKTAITKGFSAFRNDTSLKVIQKSAASIKSVSEKIDPDVLSSPDSMVDVIVELDRNDSLPYINAAEKKKFGLGNVYSMKISKSEIAKLDSSSSVKKVALERKYKALLDVSVPLISANVFWNNNYNGSGIDVCVLDTGMNKTHSALAGRVVAEKDFTNSTNGTADVYGHGTHVAGIVASANSTYRGVASGASLLNAKVLNDTGIGIDSWIMNGIDWCIANNASILTMSFGAADSPNDGSDALSQYADKAADQGKIVTVAAGNAGPGTDTIGCPGCAKKVITVGSTQTNKSGTTDVISSFSSRGPTDDGRVKPDVMAPGEQITSAWLTGFATKSGTSMATPHVAGLAALILQARSMSPEEVKALLMNTAVDLGNASKDNIYGAGRINASRVFSEINNTILSSIDPSIYKVHNIFVPSGSNEIRAALYWPENYSYHNDVDLYLLDPAGYTRAFSTSWLNTDEMINLSNPSPSGNWKLIIDPYNVSGNQTYALASNFKPSEQMFIVFGNITNTTLYHQINVTNSSRITVDLDWNLTYINLDIYLYNTTGSLINYSTSANNYEEVSASTPENGIWLAKIVTSNKTQTFYSLSSTFAVSQQIPDSTAPNVTITEPLNKTYSTKNINLTFKAADNIKTLLTCYSTLDNITNFLGNIQNNLLSTTNFSVSDATHNISVKCTDGANNSGSLLVNFSVDTTPPSITFVSPSDANYSIVNRNYTLISVTAADTSNIDSCTLEWRSSNESMLKIGSGNSVSCIANKTDSDGSYDYKVYSNDSLGNSGNASRAITFDTTSPSVTSASPANGSYIFGSNENFSVTYSELNLQRMSIYVNNSFDGNYSSNLPVNLSCTSGINQTCYYSSNLSSYPEGVLYYYFNAADPFSQSWSTAATLTIDRTPPNVSITSPSNNLKTGSSNITLNYTVFDISPVSCSYALNNQTKVNLTSNISLVASQGNSAITIFCKDSAGNAGNSSAAFFVDSVYPAISLLSPQNITYSRKNLLEINFTVSDINLDKKWYKIDNGTNVTISGNSTFSTSEGSHIFYLFANDTVNNINSSSAGFTADTTPIGISFNDPTPNNTFFDMKNSITINASTSETPSSIILEWNGINESINGSGTNWFKSKTGVPDGNYTFKIYLNDSAGNANSSETRWVLINATRDLTSSINNIRQNLSSQSINLTLLDSSGNAANISQLLSFGNYTLQFNISSLLVQTANFVVGSLNSSSSINVTNNITSAANISSAFNNSGGSLDSYVWIDLNNLLPPGSFTAKILFPRVYALYFYLNGTKDAPALTRVTSVCYSNLTNTPCYNISGNTSTLYLPSFSGGAGGNDTQQPYINITSPAQTTYSLSSISLSFTASDNAAVDKCWYSLNSGANTTLASCANTTITASSGPNSLVLYVNDTSNNINSSSVNFTYTPPASSSSSSGGGGGGGGGGAATPPSNQQNNTQNATTTLNISPTTQPIQNITEAAPREQTSSTATNQTTNENTTGTGVTGLAAGSRDSLIITSGAIILVIIAGIIAWKFKLKSKKKR